MYKGGKVRTYEAKLLKMPKTDCEVLFTGACPHKTRELFVSVKPDMKRNTPKVL